jgi:hypothetical protein
MNKNFKVKNQSLIMNYQEVNLKLIIKIELKKFNKIKKLF